MQIHQVTRKVAVRVNKKKSLKMMTEKEKMKLKKRKEKYKRKKRILLTKTLMRDKRLQINIKKEMKVLNKEAAEALQQNQAQEMNQQEIK